MANRQEISDRLSSNQQSGNVASNLKIKATRNTGFSSTYMIIIIAAMKDLISFYNRSR